MKAQKKRREKAHIETGGGLGGVCLQVRYDKSGSFYMIRPVRLLHKGRRGQRTADRGEGWAGQEKDCILWQKGDFKKG